MSHNIHFTLVIDDFAVRYMDCVDAEHLLNALKDHYQVTEDWDIRVTNYATKIIF